MNKQAAGLRKSSMESLGAQQLARGFREGTDAYVVSRTGALRVAKRAAAAMGLKAAKIALIDQLFAASRPGDWGVPGQAPIVWPSNASLAQSLGVSISTLKHHLNGLVKARLITYSDHPTYQRRGRRDAAGKIVEAYGIDLSPIAARFPELTDMAEAAEYQAREWKRHSYRRTVLRKEIQSLILSATQHKLPGPWSHHQARLDVLREQRPADLDELVAQVEGLEELLEAVEKAYRVGFEEQNFDTAVSKFRPLQTTDESLNPEKSNQNSEQRRAHARQVFSQEVCDHSSEKKSELGFPASAIDKSGLQSLGGGRPVHFLAADAVGLPGRRAARPRRVRGLADLARSGPDAVRFGRHQPAGLAGSGRHPGP